MEWTERNKKKHKIVVVVKMMERKMTIFITVHPLVQCKHLPSIGLQVPPFWHRQLDAQFWPWVPSGQGSSHLRHNFFSFTTIITTRDTILIQWAVPSWTAIFQYSRLPYRLFFESEKRRNCIIYIRCIETPISERNKKLAPARANRFPRKPIFVF